MLFLFSSGIGFVPTDLAITVVWLRHDLGVLAPGGSPAADQDPVETWVDQSAAGNDFSQADAGSRPIFDAAYGVRF
jgi:hypothetical protein